MECSFCQSQDTTLKRGVSKKTGQPWSAYDCNEPNCKNDKGYPNRTFVPRSNGSRNSPNSKFRPSGVSGSNQTSPPYPAILEKLDRILNILGDKKEKTEVEHSEISQIQDDDF